MKKITAGSLATIRRLSYPVWLFCLGGLIFTVASLIVSGFQIELSSGGRSAVDVRRDNAAAFLGALPMRVCMIFLFWGAARLFRCFTQGQIFTPATVAAFRTFAFAFLGATLAGLVRGPLINLASLALGIPQSADLSFTINQHHVTGLGVSLVLVTLSLVHALAKEHADDVRLIL